MTATASATVMHSMHVKSSSRERSFMPLPRSCSRGAIGLVVVQPISLAAALAGSAHATAQSPSLLLPSSELLVSQLPPSLLSLSASDISGWRASYRLSGCILHHIGMHIMNLHVMSGDGRAYTMRSAAAAYPENEF